jgi:hypothetical protein
MSTAEHTGTWYRKHRVKRLARDKRNRETNARLIHEYKLAHPCAFCSETEPACLDFHHIDSSTKKFTIAVSVQHQWKTLLTEIEKCIVICSNCHRKVHAGLISLISE